MSNCAKDRAKEQTEDRDRVNEGKEYRQEIIDKTSVKSSVAESFDPLEKKDKSES